MAPISLASKVIHAINRLAPPPTQGGRGQIKHRNLFQSNLRFLLPEEPEESEGIVVTPDRRIRIEFVVPFVEQFFTLHGIEGIKKGAFVKELISSGAIEDKQIPQAASQLAYNAIVVTELQRHELEQERAARQRLVVLEDTIKKLFNPNITQKERYAILVESIVDDRVFDYSEVRGYKVDFNDEAGKWFWEEFLAHGVKSRSRFAEKAGTPDDNEEKSFLFRLIKGQVTESERKEDEGRGFFQATINDDFAIFRIPSREKCYFVDKEATEKDEKSYGKGRVDELMFLVLGDIKKGHSYTVYQITNWAKAAQLTTDWRGERALLETLAKALRASEKIEVSREELKAQATKDPLTGLNNRRVFNQQLPIELRRTARGGTFITMVEVDIDNFKSVNDTYGHPFGDEIIKGVANIIRKNVRATDIVVRYGGEEFYIICSETDLEGGKTLAEKIRKGVEALEFEYLGQAVKVTISLGVAACGKSSATEMLDAFKKGMDPGQLKIVEMADEALYQAKRGILHLEGGEEIRRLPKNQWVAHAFLPEDKQPG